MKFEKMYDELSDEEYLEFDKVENKFSQRADLHAFILLDKLVPGTMDMVSAAEHDEIWLYIEPDDLDKVATDEQKLELIRCGVRYDSETDSLAMFV